MDAKGKYNLLLMHDDGAIRGFRMTRSGLRLLIALIVLLPLLGVGGLWVGWMAFEHKQQWDEEERVLQQELADVRVQLERLGHIEKLVQLHESGVFPEDQLVVSRNGTAQAEVAQGEGEATDPEPLNGNAVRGTLSSAEPDAHAEASTQAETRQGESDNPDLAAVDTGQVRVDNVSARLGADRLLRVHLDLHNESGRQVSGRMLFFLVAGDGARHPLPHHDSTFRISRFKKFVATCPIPDSVSELTNASLLVQVTGPDDAVFLRQLFPVSH